MKEDNINMTTTTITSNSSNTDSKQASSAFPDLLRSEWTKFRSVKSSLWSLIVANGITIVLSVVICQAIVSRWNQRPLAERLIFDPTARSLTGIFLAQLAIGVLGVLVITSEYSSGTIRATFTARPQRNLVLAAKAIVFAVVTFITCLIAILIAFAVGQAIFTQVGAGASITSPGVLRSIIGSTLYLTVGGLLALGLGTLVRHTAGGITCFVGMILVLPGIVNALPSPWSYDIGKFLPSEAGLVVTSVVRDGAGHLLGPWTGFLVFCAWAAVALVLAGWTLHRRDA